MQTNEIPIDRGTGKLKDFLKLISENQSQTRKLDRDLIRAIKHASQMKNIINDLGERELKEAIAIRDEAALFRRQGEAFYRKAEQEKKEAQAILTTSKIDENFLFPNEELLNFKMPVFPNVEELLNFKMPGIPEAFNYTTLEALNFAKPYLKKE